MLKATLQGLLAHRLRLALTALAVVLGVAFVSGTYVFTDTLNATFTRIFTSSSAGVAVTVRGHRLVVSSFNESVPRHPVPATLVTTIKRVSGVKDAAGVVEGEIAIVKNGASISSGAPSFAVDWIGNQQLSSFRIVSGSPPRTPTEVAVDASTVRREGFAVGQTIQIVPANGPVESFTMVGVFKLGSTTSLGGASFAAFTPATAERVLDLTGKFNSIEVQAQPGVSDAVLRGRVAAAVGSRYEVITAAAAAREAQQAIDQALSFINIALLVFGVIALFVGSFIIINTFSILVVQRSREFSLLRALGATRRQVLVSVLLEALIVGVLASAVGVLAGVGLAAALFRVFAATGLDLPSSGLSIQGRTVLIGLVLGTVITVAASLFPARRATRSAPVAALRESVAEAAGVGVIQVAAGAALLALGIILIGLGLYGNSNRGLVELGVGCLIGFLGVALLSPLLVRPVAMVLGWPVEKLRGVPGQLARRNAQRSPRRSAATAAALMVGLAVVACFSTIAASADASLAAQVGGAQKAEFQVRARGNTDFSPTVAAALSQDSRLRDVEELREGVFRQANGDQAPVLAIGLQHRAATIGIDMVQGSASALNDNTLLVSQVAAQAGGLKVGSTLPMQMEDGAVITPTVAGVYRTSALLGDYILALPTYSRHVARPRDILVLVNGAPGASESQTRAALKSDLKPYPTLLVQDRAEYVHDQEGQLAKLLNLVYALLALSLVIALLGIVNTLALSVIERTRELGLLRAVGLSRNQTRAMVRWESVIIALLGAILGISIGVALAAAIVRALYSQGITNFAVSGPQLVAAAVFAFGAGILAAVFPARRAARLRLLDALATE